MSQGIQRSAGSTAPSADQGFIGEPDLVRVSVLGGNTQFDVGLPAGVSIADLIPELLAHIRSRVDNLPRGATARRADDDEAPSAKPHLWTLSMIGGERLPTHLTLSDAGVRDGELLVLQSTKSGSVPPLFDDVICAEMSVRDGRYTGELLAVPPTGEVRAQALRDYAGLSFVAGVRVMPAALGGEAGLVGAAALLREPGEHAQTRTP